jgi:hypothetical protein
MTQLKTPGMLVRLSSDGDSDSAVETSVADSATSVQLIAANPIRRGVTITNDSSARLYVRLGSDAATTALYTVALNQFDVYEVPLGFTGAIQGIWASDPNDGAARVTEFL